MIIMTDGLHALAGKAMRTALMRFTRNPVTGVMTGAVSTAILQSSSATTVAAVGFVGTGLMTFPEALGIVFGANVGTTITGWLVALLGFKLQLSTLLLPLILVGAALKLFARGRIAASGYTLAGFGLIFVGITTMQQGMSGLENIISFANIPADSFLSRLQLVVMGIVFTVITQSSSAGVAAALTALFTHIINFEQAAALVIGMDIGTTITALIATIGGSTGARRTGYSHVIYNFFTGGGAILLITPYTLLWEWLAPGQLTENAEIALVAFHTSFNAIGVIIATTLTAQFVKLLERLVPEKGLSYTQPLDRSLLTEPSLALTAAQQAVFAELLALLGHINAILSNNQAGRYINIEEMGNILDKTHHYIDHIHLNPNEVANWERLISIIHTLDHLQRLHSRCEEEDRPRIARNTALLTPLTQLQITAIQEIISALEKQKWHEAAKSSEQIAYEIHKQQEPLRNDIVASMAKGEIDTTEVRLYLEAIRWLERVSNHIARITYHYEQAMLAAGK